MEYNDFPILDNSQYKLMQDKFNEQFSFDRKETVFIIYSSLTECNFTCTLLYAKLNKTICESLKQSNEKLELAISNLEATFNLHLNKTEVKEMSIFGFLCKLTNCLKQINLWQQKEQKEYFKHFALQLSADLTAVLSNILSAIEKSNIQLYKYL